METMTRKCSVDGCENKHNSRGYCKKHYSRILRTGSVADSPMGGIRSPEHLTKTRMASQRRKRPAEDRFWEKVDKTEGCWLWTAWVDKDGYGRFLGNDRRQVMAHRFSYELLSGTIPQGMVLDHRKTCPKNCVNPDHLKVVTPKQNNENRAGANPGSKSGVRGVHWESKRGVWRATAKHHNKLHVAGYFKTIEEADIAAKELRNRLFTNNDED